MENLYKSESRGASLFIGGLSKETSLKEIIGYVEQFSPVTYFHMPVHKVTGKPVGYAFVRLADPRVAAWLVQRANRIGGRLVDVQFAIDKEYKETYKQDLLKRKIFIAGIKHFVDFNRIQMALEAFGELKIFYRIETSHKNRGLAFAEFNDTSAAELAVSQGLSVDGCQLRVSFFRPKPGTDSNNYLLSQEQISQIYEDSTLQGPYPNREVYFNESQQGSQLLPEIHHDSQGESYISNQEDESSRTCESNYIYRVATKGTSISAIKKIHMHGASLYLKSEGQKNLTLEKNSFNPSPSKGHSRKSEIPSRFNLNNRVADSSGYKNLTQSRPIEEQVNDDKSPTDSKKLK